MTRAPPAPQPGLSLGCAVLRQGMKELSCCRGLSSACRRATHAYGLTLPKSTARVSKRQMFMQGCQFCLIACVTTV